ncbi:MAG: hypothetical protein QOG46_2831, partial [Pseudonocardiales bacterium]|nr:hypothetical protein [Pseudonocardiales bacterium]
EEESQPVAVVEPERPAPKQYRPSNEPASESAPAPRATERPTERPTYSGVGSADEDRPPRHGLGLLDT